jgi:hypothetical protein
MGIKWINSIWVFRMVQSCMKLTIFGRPPPLLTGEKIEAINALVCSDRWLTVWESGKCRTIGGIIFWNVDNIWSCGMVLQNLFHAFSQVNICTDILQQDKMSGVVRRLSQNMLVKHHCVSMYICKCNLIYAHMKSTTLFAPIRKCLLCILMCRPLIQTQTGQ